MAEQRTNAGFSFACRDQNLTEAAQGNRVKSGCAVTAQGSPDMTVDIAAGVVRINNAYVVVSAVDNQAVTAADGANDRYDIIYVGVDATVHYLAGTATAAPYPPDLPAEHILLSILYIAQSSSQVDPGDIADNRIIEEDTGVQVPIGGIIQWAKTLTGVPAIPTGYVECDGATLSDSESPINGQAVPNLTNKFIRGATASGGTGGSDTMAHTHTGSTGGPSATVAVEKLNENISPASGNHSHSFTTSAASNDDNKPAYYAVVFIIRVK